MKLKVVYDICKAHNNMCRLLVNEGTKTTAIKFLKKQIDPSSFDVRVAVYDDNTFVTLSWYHTGDDLLKNPNIFDGFNEYSDKW